MSEAESLSFPILEVSGSDPADTTIIRPIAGDAEMSMVHRLTHDCYVAQGYASPQPDRRLVHFADFDGLPQTTVIVAIHLGEVVGSVSMTVDGPWGLTVDKDFRDVCDSLRYAGRSLAVIWRLVMKRDLNPSRRILMALFRETTALATLQGANTGLLTVNPRHASMYQRFFNMKEMSAKSSTKFLANAPAVLLRYDYELLPQSWRRFAESAQIRQMAWLTPRK